MAKALYFRHLPKCQYELSIDNAWYTHTHAHSHTHTHTHTHAHSHSHTHALHLESPGVDDTLEPVFVLHGFDEARNKLTSLMDI